MIAPGIACGPAVVWGPASEPVPQRRIPASSVFVEKRRLEHALRRARHELEEIALRVEVMAGKSAAAVFRAHEAMLADTALDAAIVRGIEEQHLAAESAVALAIESYAKRLAGLGNEYLAARSGYAGRWPPIRSTRSSFWDWASMNSA